MICKKYFDIKIAISILINFFLSKTTKENICAGSSLHCTSFSTKSRHQRKLVDTRRCKHRLRKSEYATENVQLSNSIAVQCTYLAQRGKVCNV